MSRRGLTAIPAIALRGSTILPGMIAHFDIGRPMSIAAVEKAMATDQEIFLITQRDEEVEEPKRSDLYHVGTLSHVRQVVRLAKDKVRILVEGIQTAELWSFYTEDCTMAEIEFLTDKGLSPHEEEAIYDMLHYAFRTYAEANDGLSREVAEKILQIREPDYLAEQISIHIPISYRKQQRILECDELLDRAVEICAILEEETDLLMLKSDITRKVKEKVDKNQKEYVLREQLKVIREELGETSSTDADEFTEKCEALTASEEVKDKIREEISHLRAMSSQTPEANVLHTYIETLLKMPWDKMGHDLDDLKRAKEILDRDHYGMEDIKERILEFLAVRMLAKRTGITADEKDRSGGSILCLVGPPGTGKTSICRSVAEALGKEYVRLSLGGIHDEAEIRGHRRTYIGAMPGRIAKAVMKAGVKNPLIVLDEIDKLSASYKGEASSAMLEVLDSAQNDRFEDHYIEIPIDLSEVFFITTANDAASIPRPLYDRMEVIEVSSYTENEKLHIAKDYLLPRQIRTNALTPKQISVSDKVLEMIISGYTREAGVRTLERRIGAVCRKAARRLMEGETKKISVSRRNLTDFLGPVKYRTESARKKDEVGIVCGLAWTAVGGVTLEVEVNVMPGKGEILLTGQLGDVMKESARTGISAIRGMAEELGIEEEAFSKKDVHIHIPEGAVPKDGPSAGITMALAMVSAYTGRPVRSDVAMTGEITLRGRVLPIGGLKEKLLAAAKAGIKTVLIPQENEKDLAEISEEITGGLKIIPVSDFRRVLKEALL